MTWRHHLSRVVCAGSVVVCFWGALATGEETRPNVEQLQKELTTGDLQKRRDAAWQLAAQGKDSAPALTVLQLAVSDNDPQVANGALQALAQLGPLGEPAIPLLLERLSNGDDQHRLRVAYALGHIATNQPDVLQPALSHASARVRAGAALAVGWLGPAAAGHLEKLVFLVGDDEESVATNASESLRQLGAATVPAMITGLGAANGPATVRLVRILGELGSAAEAACPMLLDRLSSADPTLRPVLLASLAQIAPSDSQVTKAVTNGLTDTELSVRLVALEALTRMPDAAPSALPSILAQLDAEEDAARVASLVLQELGPAARPALPDLLVRLRVKEDPALEQAIGRMGPSILDDVSGAVERGELTSQTASRIVVGMGPSLRPRVLAMLQHDQPSVRAMACLALGQWTDDAAFLPTLIPVLQDPAAEVRAAAATSIGLRGNVAQSAQDPLMQLAQDPDPTARSAALRSLFAIGASPDQLLEPLLAGLKDGDPGVRQQSVIGLATFEKLPEQAVSGLRESLQDADASVRAAGAGALGRAGKAAGSAANDLAALLQDRVPAVRQRAIEAMGSLGELSAEHLQALIDQTRDADPMVQRTAIAALGQLGSGAQAALPSLQELRSSTHDEIRQASLQAITKIQPDRGLAAKELLSALDDSQWTVRRQASLLLGELGSDAMPAVPRLIGLLRTEQNADAVTEALRKIDQAPPEALPLLMELLEDENLERRRRFYALHLLRKLGPQAKEALPTLQKLAEKADGRNREMLERTIREISGE